MFPIKKILVVFIGILLIFAMAGCAVDKTPPKEVEAPADIPVEIPDEKDVPDEKAEPKEYTGWVGAYLDILAENSVEMEDAMRFGISSISSTGPVTILDVFDDETPELLYLYRYDDPDNSGVPCIFLKIISYSESGVTETVFDSSVHIAAGGPNNFCVYLTHLGELMLYRSNFANGSPGWGFWRIAPNQKIESTGESLVGNYNSDLAKLYYVWQSSYVDDEGTASYKEYGKEISKEQYDKTAKEIMGDIGHVIFQNLYPPGSGFDDLWNDITPLKSESMTYDEAVAWLEAQGGCPIRRGI